MLTSNNYRTLHNSEESWPEAVRKGLCWLHQLPSQHLQLDTHTHTHTPGRAVGLIQHYITWVHCLCVCVQYVCTQTALIAISQGHY